MVVAGEDEDAREIDQPLVERFDRLQVEVLRRLVEEEAVGARQHQAREEAAHALPAGEDAHGLQPLVAREQHPPQEGADEGRVVARAVLREPVDERQVGLEQARVLPREIRPRDGLAPGEGAGVGGVLAGQDAEERRLREVLAADQRDLVGRDDGEVQAGEHRPSPDRFREAGGLQDDVPHRAGRLEGDVGEPAARGHEVVDLELFQDLLP